MTSSDKATICAAPRKRGAILDTIISFDVRGDAAADALCAGLRLI